jgi:hypothetical protein
MFVFPVDFPKMEAEIYNGDEDLFRLSGSSRLLKQAGLRSWGMIRFARLAFLAGFLSRRKQYAERESAQVRQFK